MGKPAPFEARLSAVEDRLRQALAHAPEIRRLFQEWIDLRFNKEFVCPRNLSRRNQVSIRPR